MKTEELRGKTPDELKTQLVELKKEAFNLRFRKASGQLENTARKRVVRRDIARIKTVLPKKAKAEPNDRMRKRRRRRKLLVKRNKRS